MSDARIQMHDWLVQQEWLPYVYDAKGECHADPAGKQVACYDCSGLVTCALFHAGGPDWRKTHGAAGLFDALEHVEEPLPMDIAAYGAPGHVDHVMVVWGDGRVYGASGGNSYTTSVELALARKACVHFKDSVAYRPDFRAYLRLPFL